MIDTARFLADHPENAGVSDAIKLARAYVSLFEQVQSMQRELEQWSVGLGPGPERMKELREAQRGR